MAEAQWEEVYPEARWAFFWQLGDSGYHLEGTRES